MHYQANLLLTVFVDLLEHCSFPILRSKNEKAKSFLHTRGNLQGISFDGLRVGDCSIDASFDEFDPHFGAVVNSLQFLFRFIGRYVCDGRLVVILVIFQCALLAHNLFASFTQEPQSLSVDLTLWFIGRMNVDSVKHRSSDTADRSDPITHADNSVLLRKSIDFVLISTFRAKHVIAIEASAYRIVVTVAAENASRRAVRRAICVRRSTPRNVQRFRVAAVAENVNRIRGVDAVVAERVDDIAGTSSIKWIEYREETVSVHRGIV